jgi:hypothetical protein
VITEQMVYARLAMENLETTKRERVQAEARRLEASEPELGPQKPSG